MFGYITVNQDELKMKDARRYRSYYCGLCHELGSKYGAAGRIALSYDMTFLAILLSALYEGPLKEEKRRCIPHPLTRRETRRGVYTSYTADMTMLLMYYKMRDDVSDDGSIRARAYLAAEGRYIERLRERYPEKAELIKEKLGKLADAEFANIHELDYVSGLFGDITAEVFAPRKDEWEDELRRMGFYLGKFIYLLDAYEDLKKDMKKGAYNPWENLAVRKDFDALVENTLTMMIAECAKEFEKLPIVSEVEILRNVLYCGAWSKFEEVKKKREEERE
ncbi:MAG: DUF5685 family protein [Lachnospiraceae bacterium]|nr:DUF5685 family protein [Lachnospiraceae bacterium]